jgi:hypothetical protein
MVGGMGHGAAPLVYMSFGPKRPPPQAQPPSLFG